MLQVGFQYNDVAVSSGEMVFLVCVRTDFLFFFLMERGPVPTCHHHR